MSGKRYGLTFNHRPTNTDTKENEDSFGLARPLVVDTSCINTDSSLSPLNSIVTKVLKVLKGIEVVLIKFDRPRSLNVNCLRVVEN